MHITSFNVNGISQEKKRKLIFAKCNELNSIIFLQETHSTPNDENRWKNDWSGNIVFAHGSSKSKGVCIMIPQNIDHDIEDKIIDDNGRILIIKIKINTELFILCNIYAPTRQFKAEQIKFIKDFKNYLSKYEHQNLIIGGDFNLYLNPTLDKLDSMSNKNDNPVYRNEIVSMLEAMDLNDAWRTLFPTSRRYTWHARGRSSRLDYFFISDHLLNNLNSYKILPGLHSDHSILIMKLEFDFMSRGRGYWKFNTELLHDVNYVKNIKQIIKQSHTELSNYRDSGLIWEIVKLKIRSFSVPYCIKKKKERAKFKKKLESDLENLQAKLDENNNDNELLENYNTTKKEMEDIEKENINKLIFRSKARWVEEGEKNTRYFLNLEKKNYLNKVITTLNIDGKIITDPQKISKEQTKFYQNLYTEKLDSNSSSYIESEKTFFDNNEHPKLTPIQNKFCENDLNETEILTSLKNLNNGKTPGTDGFPCDFYKFFWGDIKYLVINSLKYALVTNEMSIEQRRGIISLIPKKEKNRMFLKNWRPISLLNTDYKLLAKILASRLQNVLPDIINDDQTGYLKNRYIGQNIRLLEDVSFFTTKENIPGIIFSIDFEKAFDSVNWNFLYKTLKFFNFGNNFISYIKTMYNNIESTVMNNGITDKFFTLECGVRQGCPLSAYLFILTIEVLAIQIRNNPHIKGIKIGNHYLKISLLADDITLLLNDLNSVKITLDTLKSFKACSGLKINIEKSKAKYIGSLKTCDHFPHGLSWIKTPIETLGISITNDPEQNYKLNFQKRIETLKTTLNIWSQRNLSIKGKITIVNNLALSPLVYVASVTNTPNKAITEINNVIQNFIWRNKTAKISQKTLIQDINKGGLKLCHFESKVISLMLSWTKRLTSKTNARWKLLPKIFFQCNNLQTYFNSNHKLLNVKEIPTFYKNIHKHFMKYFKKQPENLNEILDESLWLNEHIKIKNNYIYFKNWEEKNILKVRDLFNQFGKLMKHEDLTEKYKINTNFLHTLQIHDSLPVEWIRHIKNTHTNLPSTNTEINIKINDKVQELNMTSSKQFYWHIININKHHPTCILKWSEIYNTLNKSYNLQWKKIFNLSFYICRETKIQSFQYNIIHRTIACNRWLYNIKILDSDICIICNNNEPETIQHFFLLCNKVNHFWVSFNNWWVRLTGKILIKMAEPNNLQQCLLLGFPDQSEITEVLNYCVIHAKYFIYNRKINKCNDIFIMDYLIYLKLKLKQEKYISESNNREKKFTKFLFILDNI